MFGSADKASFPPVSKAAHTAMSAILREPDATAPQRGLRFISFSASISTKHKNVRCAVLHGERTCSDC